MAGGVLDLDLCLLPLLEPDLLDLLLGDLLLGDLVLLADLLSDLV